MIVGSGGREDALAWKLRQSAGVRDIFIAPGNGGSERFSYTHQVLLNPKNNIEVMQAARDFDVGLVVIGPEDSLALGLADDLRANRITTYGPGQAGAVLEASKAGAVLFMSDNGIPHPYSRIFENFNDARRYVKNPKRSKGRNNGLVVKADGLAAGKGVFVCETREEAEEALVRLMQEKEFGQAGERVVIQEKLRGYEVSVMAIVSGGKYILLPTSEDHKQIHNDDQGSNTGGMGVVAPHQLVDDRLMRQIEETIIKPTLAGLTKKRIDFRGTLYPGIMVTADGPKVLEYNVRFGDPETEAVLPLLEEDLFSVLKGAAEGNLIFNGNYSLREGSCITVTLASGGYPGKYETGKKIKGLDIVVGRKDVLVFHAGTRSKKSGIYETAGGRVLMVTGLGENIEKAREAAYGVIDQGGIHFSGMQYRSDIGMRKRG